MTTSNTTQCTTKQFDCCAPAGTTIPFENVNEPGCYICNWSGHLLRVPEDGIAPGRSPLITVVGPEALYVTKISDNPFMTLTKAKMVACNFDLAVNF